MTDHAGPDPLRWKALTVVCAADANQLRAILRAKSMDTGLDEELKFHLDRQLELLGLLVRNRPVCQRLESVYDGTSNTVLLGGKSLSIHHATLPTWYWAGH